MKFSELKLGEHFESAFSTNNVQWIKTTICAFNNCMCCNRNAVCLNDGTYVNIDLNTEVQINCHWE